MIKISYNPEDAAAATGVKRERIMEDIRLGNLPALDAEGVPIVLHHELVTWAAKFPRWDR